jgi:hypothetical protein
MAGKRSTLYAVFIFYNTKTANFRMHTLLQRFWRPPILTWKEPSAFKRFVARRYRQASPVHWFAWTLGLPFVGGICLGLFPFVLALVHGRSLVPSAPLTFIGFGVVAGVALACCSLWLHYMPATIRCHDDDLLINRGGNVQRWRYTDLARYHITTEVHGEHGLRAVLLMTKYGQQIVLGLPATLDVAPFVKTLHAYGVHAHHQE